MFDNFQSRFQYAWATAVVAGGSALIGLYESEKAGSDKKKAKAEQDRLAKPFYKIQDEYYNNQNLSTELAGQGYTSSAKDFLTEESRRGLGTGIDAIEATGGSANDISKLYGVYQQSLRNTAAGDAQQQIENIKTLMSANKDIAGQKTTKWSLDQDRTYQTKLKELKERQAIDDHNKWEGIQTAVGSLGAAATAVSNSGLIGKDKAATNPLTLDTTPTGTVSSAGQIQPTLQQNSAPPTANMNNGTLNYLPEDWNQLFQ